jgi:hypothetical protein
MELLAANKNPSLWSDWKVSLWIIGSLLSFLILGQYTFGKSIWQLEQKHLGSALAGGGWDVRYQLGSTQVVTETQIPILLNYNPTNDGKSTLFFSQWSCPQLESSIAPFSKEVMKWIQPGGDVAWFTPDPKDKGNYSTPAKDWRMTFKTNKIILIFNEQGWVYVYQDGVLISVESPTSRALNFVYNKGDLLRVELMGCRWQAKPLMLIACVYDDGHRNF